MRVEKVLQNNQLCKILSSIHASKLVVLVQYCYLKPIYIGHRQAILDDRVPKAKQPLITAHLPQRVHISCIEGVLPNIHYEMRKRRRFSDPYTNVEASYVAIVVPIRLSVKSSLYLCEGGFI